MLHPPSDPRGRRGVFYVRAAAVLFFSLSLLTQNCIIRIIQLVTVLFE